MTLAILRRALALDAPPIVAAGVAFVDPRGRVLFLHRADGEGWAFPGGGVEPGETPQQAAEREVHEETRAQTQIDVDIDRADKPFALTTIPGGGGKFATFVQKVNAPFTPLINHEHTDHVWAHPARPPEPLHPGAAQVARALSADMAADAARVLRRALSGK